MLVVARYNENVEWTREFPNKVIYNKGDRATIPADLQEYVIDLPNVGREAHTYLYHIVNNYDRLDDILIFSQGKYADHIRVSPAEFRRMFSDISGASENYYDSNCWGKTSCRSYEFTLTNFKGELGNNHLKYGTWFERVFSERYSDEKIIYANAIFSVDKLHILSRSKEFYERLLKELDYHSAPLEAHFMERSWLQTFNIHPTRN
jgi:hypothetical protein